MKLYQIEVTGPYPKRYRGLTGATDTEAVHKAQQRHRDSGLPVEGHACNIASSQVIVCGSVVDQAPDALHTISLTDSLLSEIELALLERARFLEETADRVSKRGALAKAAIHRIRLGHTRAALHLVTTV